MSDLQWSQIATGAIAVGFAVILAVAAVIFARLKKKISVGPVFVATAFVLILLYLLAFAVDGAANAVSAQPRSPYFSFLEQLLLGRLLGLEALLPLRQRPLWAAPVHVGCVLGLYLLLLALVRWLGRVRELEPGGYHPRWVELYRLSGYDTGLRTIEGRISGWLFPLAGLAALVLALGFFEMFYLDPAHPPLRPSLWAVCWAVVASTFVNILASREPETKQKEAAEQEEPADLPGPEAWLQALRDRGFTVPVEPCWQAASMEAARTDPGELTRTPLFVELAAELTGGAGLWSHQIEVIQRIVGGRTHTLMSTAPRGGKTVTSQLLAAHIAVADGKNAMFVVRDAETAREAAERLRAALARTSWSRNLRCTVTGPEMVQLLAQRRSPTLAFAHLGGLDHILATHRAHSYLLEHLGLVVVEDLERYSGVRGANLHFLLHRLRAVLEHLRCDPVLLGTVGLPTRRLEGFAKTLLGVDLAVVGSDGGPGAPVRIHAADPPAEGALPPLAVAAAEAERLGLPVARVGFSWVTSTELERAAALVTRTKGAVHLVQPEHARVSLAELEGRSLPRLIAMTRHIGAAAAAAGADEHVQVVVPAIDPLSRWLAEDFARVTDPLRVGRVLVADPDNPFLRVRQLRCALAELPAREAWATRVFGRESVAQLEREGSLSRASEMALGGDPARLEAVDVLRLRGEAEAGLAAAVETVGDLPVEVVDHATGAVVRQLDPTRAPLVAYPGAVLLWRGQRYRVPLERQRYLAGAKIRADFFGEDVRTFRLRSLSTDVLDAGALKPLSIGGQNLVGGLVRVRVTETVTGVRRHRSDGALDELLTYEPIETTITSVARILLLGQGVGTPALRAVAQLLRVCLPAVMDCGEEGLHVAHAPVLRNAPELEGEGPVLQLIDTYEGGAGYARAADWGVLREALELARRILDQGCCTEGCPRCVRTIFSHHPDPQGVELDREGARQLVRRMVGPGR